MKVDFSYTIRDRLPLILKDGGKPADVYFNPKTGCIYVVIDEEDGWKPISFVEEENKNLDLKTKEGLEKIGSKVQEEKMERSSNEWYKDFPQLKGVFKEYGSN